MIIRFTYNVDFVNYPMEPPTKENCLKCAFYYGHCIRPELNCGMCDFGRNGYFIKKSMYELPEERKGL